MRADKEQKRAEYLLLFPLQGLLQREKGPEAQSLDQLTKQRNLPENQQEAFKTGFTEGFMKSQAFTQRTQGMWLTFLVFSCTRFLWMAVLS